MTRAEYAAYRSSPWWVARRLDYLEEHPACATCHLPRDMARRWYDQDLHVHHLSYEHLGAELDSDLEAKCARCHRVSHRLDVQGMPNYIEYEPFLEIAELLVPA